MPATIPSKTGSATSSTTKACEGEIRISGYVWLLPRLVEALVPVLGAGESTIDVCSEAGSSVRSESESWATRSDTVPPLEMCDNSDRWSVEMLVKALIHGLRPAEVPVETRRMRHAESTIDGPLSDVLRECRTPLEHWSVAGSGSPSLETFMTRLTQSSASSPNWTLRSSTIGLGMALVVTSASGQFNEAEAIAFWEVSDESSQHQIDHGPWQELLDSHLSVHSEGPNLFDYAGLNSNMADRRKLGAYLDQLQRLDPRKYSRAEQKAYWINFYNALTVKIVSDHYPVKSIRDIRSKQWLAGLVFPGPWDDTYARVAGQDITLNNIEHGILRPIWVDNRVHYGVNCASYSCPNLLATAFTAENTEELLEAGARAYVNDTRGVDMVDEDFMVVSGIYDWFKEDFGGSEEGVLEHLRLYADGELAESLRKFEGAIDYDYDWNLNAR